MLLRAVMATHLAEGKDVSEMPTLLSNAVASIRQHSLLRETSRSPVASGLKTKSGLNASKAANDAWMEKVFRLLSDSVAENKWAGICLLGVTYRECSRQRFLECFNSWSLKLLPFLKQQTEPVFVRAAACASLTDLFVRLAGFTEMIGVRRDGSSLISKLVQPLLQIIGDKDSNVLLNEAMDLLIAILKSFPSCLRAQSINIEVLLVARLTDLSCQSNACEKCAKALGFLPVVHGDAATWSSFIRRVLIAINSDLDFAFRGMEDPSVGESATRALQPQGHDTPRALGIPAVPASSGIQTGNNFMRQLLPRISYLLQCCNYLLTSPYPTSVPAPIGPLLALVVRILGVDGSKSSSALSSTVFSSQQVALRSELPSLHLSALGLLAATLRGVRGQLVLRGAAIARLLTDHFRHSGGVYSSLRIKLYDVSRQLFVLMGAGMASALAPAVVRSALFDLKGSTSREHLSFSNSMKVPEVGNDSVKLNPRKRKEPGSVPVEQSINGVAESAKDEGDGKPALAVQVAALQALEALLNTGGALLPERWRAEVDAVLAGVAIGVAADTTSFNLSCDEDIGFSRSPDGKSVPIHFQVAAYQALLSSLLAPSGHRPPYLAVGLALFRNGRKEVGTEIATVCARALTALELLIHPRCLPPAYVFTEMGAGLTNSGSSLQDKSRHLSRGGNEYGLSGGSSKKFGYVSMDPWSEVDTWLGYGEATGDDLITRPDSSNAPNGAVNGNPGNLAADRVTSTHHASSDLVTVTSSLATSTIVKTLVTFSTSQGNLEPGSVLERETERVAVSTSGVSTSKDQLQQFPKVVSTSGVSGAPETVEAVPWMSKAVSTSLVSPSKDHDVGSDSDSDGPLPAIVDGDPDSESD